MNNTMSIKLINNIPITIPNKVLDGNGFYISYNNYDTALYGNDTTALVDNDMKEFRILNGDHRKKYNKLIPKGFKKCCDYFNNNLDKINKMSTYHR